MPPEASAQLQDLLAQAISHHQNGRLPDAERLYRQILQIAPRHADALNLLGVVALQAGRPDLAVELIAKAIAENPDAADYHGNLGNGFMALGRPGDAAAAYRQVLRQRPDDAETSYNLGLACQLQGVDDMAEDSYRQALLHHPLYAEAHFNLGTLFQAQGKLDPAVDCYRKTLILRPEMTEAQYNLGHSLAESALPEAAIAPFRRAITLRPDHALAHYNLGNSLLAVGQMAEGWTEYEWRWRDRANGQAPRNFSQPQWRGEDPAGRTLLLHAEIGLGDSLQFCRYVAQVAALKAKIIIEIQRPLLDLLSPLSGITTLVASGDPLPPFDLHCPLMSLPLAFGTSLETIPPPLSQLSVEPALIAAWRRSLPDRGFRIGICWASTPTPGLADRSPPIGLFTLLQQVPGVQLISLQKTFGLEDLRSVPAGTITTLGPDYDKGGFLDTAAIMMSLDLIVTLDSAVAHLAASLGRPVWIPLKKMPHWIWGMTGETTAWYPSARLFRQTIQDEWQDVFERMAAGLAEIVP